jgi:branched-subunit amino acid aminotransferase/4-amino-4-deoxychorismate lyase
VFLVEGTGLATPPLDCGVLVGTTREWVISSGAPQLKVVVREDRLTPDELFAAGEAFLASSVGGILPIARIDDRSIGTGRPGVWTMRLRAARELMAGLAWVDLDRDRPNSRGQHRFEGTRS